MVALACTLVVLALSDRRILSESARRVAVASRPFHCRAAHSSLVMVACTIPASSSSSCLLLILLSLLLSVLLGIAHVDLLESDIYSVCTFMFYTACPA